VRSSHPKQVHGSLIEVCGLGILILGPSGVGKSECVIELVRRGQRMVSDDVVRLWTQDSTREGTQEGTGGGASERGKRLFGRSPKSIRHHIEVRGIGLLSVADLYGPESVLDESPIDFVCRLEGWREGRHYERIGLERPVETFLGVALPTVTLPVHAASNLATLVELVARDWKLRQEGINAAQRLDERLRIRGGMLAAQDSVEGEET
jgi:HPr kinase/phosphorylase